jgi:hypothetical protein
MGRAPLCLHVFTLFTKQTRKRAHLIILLGLMGLVATALATSTAAGRLAGKLLLQKFSDSGGRTQKVFSPFVSTAGALQSLGVMLSVERSGHTATTLGDGRVLIVGGENANGMVGQTELFDPASSSFSIGGNLNAPRADHTATKLPDGRVLIAGGRDATGPLYSTEIFDPATGAFVNGPALSVARSGHSATLLSNGTVLLAGGDVAGSAEIYDAAADSLTSVTATMTVARSMHSAVLMQAGRVLLVGGKDPTGRDILSGEIFDANAGTFTVTANSLQDEHVRSMLRVLPDGKVQIIGGSDHEVMEVYDPAANIFGAHAHVFPLGDQHPNLVNEILSAPTRAALFHHGASSLLLDREGQTIAELPGSNQALVAGGTNGAGAYLSSASLLNSSPATVTTDKLDYAPSTTVVVTGAGWQPNELVTVTLHEDPHVPTENPHTFIVQADANGDFIFQQYAPEDGDAGVSYIVAAVGQSSAWTAQTAFTDTAKFWKGCASTNWSGSSNNWSTSSSATCSGGVVSTGNTTPPGSSDTASIPTLVANSAGYPIVGTSAGTIQNLVISSGAQMTIATGGSLTVSAGSNDILLGLGTLFVNDGSITFTMSSSGDQLRLSNGSSPSGGAVVNQSGGTVTVNAGDFRLNHANSQYIQSAGTLNINGSYRNTDGTFSGTGGTIVFGANGGTGSSDAEFAGTAQNNFFNVQINSNFDPGFCSNNTSSDIRVAGDWMNNSSASLFSSCGSGHVLTFNGTGAQAISGSQSTAFGNVTINKASGTATLGHSQTSSGNLSIAAGALDLSTFTFNRTSSGGTITVANSAMLRLAGTTGGRSGSNFPNNFSTNTLNATSTVEYNGAGGTSQTIFSSPTYGHLTLTNGSGSGTATKTTTGTITTLGKVTIGSGVTYDTGNSLNVGGDWSVDGTFNQTGGTTTFTGGGTHNFSGAGSSQFNNLTTSSQTINAGSSDLRIKVNWSHGTSGTFNEDTSSVTFNGTGPQTQPTASFVPELYNMTINNGVTGTMSSRVWTVTNNFLLSSGTFAPSSTSSFKNWTINGGTFTAPSGTINISGDWTNDGGTFAPGTGSGNFNGGSQTIGGTSATTFAGLTIAGSADKTLGNDITVSNTLTLTNRNIVTGAQVVSADSITRNTTGHIIGNLHKSFGVGSNISRTFEVGTSSFYDPASVTFASVGTGGTVTATAISGDISDVSSPVDTSKSVNANWKLTNGGVVFTNYGATFNYSSLQIDGGAVAANFVVGKRDGSSWTAPTVSGTPTTTSITATGMASMSDFAVGEPSCAAASVTTNPTDVSIVYGNDAIFTAAGDGNPAPTVQWEVSSNGGGSYSPLSNGGNVSGATTTTLTITKPGVAQDGYKYRAVFTNTCSGTQIATSTAATLNVAAKHITGSFTADNKGYDGNDSATVLTRSLSGAIIGDDVNLSGGAATFADNNAGNGKTVTLTGASLSGTDAGNYVLDSVSAATANIDQASSTVTVTCTAGAPNTYTGSAQTPCTAEATGVGMSPVDVTASLVYSNNTNAGSAAADASWGGDTNHTGNTGSGGFTIGQASSTVNVIAPDSNYTGLPYSSGSASVSGAGGLNQSLPIKYVGRNSTVYGPSNTAPIVAGDYIAQARYVGDANHDTSNNSTNFTINKRSATWTTNPNSKFWGQSDPNPVTTGSSSGFVAGDGVSATYSRDPGSNAGTYHIYATLSSSVSGALNNYTITNTGNTFTIYPDGTATTLDAKTSGTNFDCTTNQYAATLKDTVTNSGLSGIQLKLTTGAQNMTATTDSNGVATFALLLNQPPGSVMESVGLNVAWSDPNRDSPSTVNRSFTIIADPNVGPGLSASTLYTGSRFFWTSSTSGTATLTLTATIRDKFDLCPGDITKAKVSFFISSNSGTSWTVVSNGQNLPVGLADPADTRTGTASVISQYNLGKDQSAQLWVKVIVGGEYLYSGDEFDVPVTVAVPGQVNTLLAGGGLMNDGISVASGGPQNMGNIFFAGGFLGAGNGLTSGGVMPDSVDFGGQVAYSKSLTNPQGQLTLLIHSYSKPDGTQDGNMHTYYVKSNSIADLSLVGNPGAKTASFSSKTNVYELVGTNRSGLDGGGVMQFMFTQPGGSYKVSSGNNTVTLTCPGGSNGCASVIVYKSTGGVWFSSAWGPVSVGGLPQTVEKTMKPGGTTYIQ